ncbi:MAG TPA: membrane-bound lytic murein transglycosylase MltF [Gammaproteobacteria bacterium]|nr:membrane-bound lytic murein transglycosylase MltF [Gammaproteobacteria bacterium]
MPLIQNISRCGRAWRSRLAGVLAGVLGLVSACDQAPPERAPGLLEKIRAQGELVVATRNAPTTYYESRDGEAGLEYDMARDFADHLGVKLRILVRGTVSEVLAAVQNGEAHLAAAGLSVTAKRRNSFLFGPVYQQVRQQVVCRRSAKLPRSVEELAGRRVRVPADTSYAEHLLTLDGDHPGLEWETTADEDTEQLLEAVWRKRLDCTVADSNIVAINQRFFPELEVAFELGQPQSLAWLLPPQATDLQRVLTMWFKGFRERGRLEAVLERYYGFVEVFDYVDTRRFTRRVRQLLPKYKKWFQDAARRNDLDWMLLAAQAYQESHWKARAISPTGVRGIMMLTLTTARELGLKSRLDPKSSIYGGARYLARIRDRLPASLPEPDRSWAALAAYNVGYGHLMDARELATRFGKNPDAWSDLAEVLPLLAQKRHYSTVKHGYARGLEPVLYVNRIRNYRDMLERALQPAARKRASDT